MVRANKVVAETGVGWGTFEAGDRIVIELVGGREPAVYRARQGFKLNTPPTYRRLATLPTAALKGGSGNGLRPFLALRGLPNARASVRLVRSGLPLWSLHTAPLYTPWHRRCALALAAAFCKATGAASDVVLHSILPFCDWTWFIVLGSPRETKAPEMLAEYEASRDQ